MRFLSRVSSRVVELILMAALAASGPLPAWASEVHHFDIPEEEAPAAIRDFGAQAHVQILVAGENVKGKKLHAVMGELSTEDGLNTLLHGSGLTHKYVGDSSVALLPLSTTDAQQTTSGSAHPPQGGKGGQGSSEGFLVAQATAGQTPSDASVERSDESTSKKMKSSELEEVLVTGSHIHGSEPVGAPMITITRDDIEKAGFQTPQELFEALPQNFHAVNNDGQYSPAAGVIAGLNSQAASAIDLYGLGPESTLVLLNGKRQVGVIEGQAVDISIIPVSIIQQIDVVTGGKSAIYGSDAVAGVVNFVTRRDFDGAETQASYGSDSGGQGQRFQFSQVVGMKAERGGFVAAFDYSKDDVFDAVKAGLAGQGTVYDTLLYASQPQKETRAGYLSGHYHLSDALELYSDALLTNESVLNPFHFNIFGTDISENTRADGTQYNVSGGVLASLSSAWKLDVSGNYSAEHTDFDQLVVVDGVPSNQPFSTKTSIGSASAIVDGPLLTIADHALRVALGADWRHETHTPGFKISQAGSRSVDAIFAEGDLPLVTEGRSAGLRRLEFSGAVRYDHYSDFGGTTNGQFGSLWSPLTGVALRASYATAFRAPSLYQKNQVSLASISEFPDPISSTGKSPVLNWNGGNPSLGPETSKTWTVGLDLKPEFAPWGKLSFDYVDIRYNERIDSPITGFPYGTYLEPQVEPLLASFINRSPTPAELDSIAASTPTGTVSNFTGLPYNPATQTLLQAFPNLVVLDARLANLAVETFQGLQFLLDTRFDTDIGYLSFGINAAHTLHHHLQYLSSTPPVNLLNDVGRPVSTRLRANAGWETGPFGAFVYVNYVRDYANSYATPPESMASWTTTDLTLRFSGAGLAQSGWLKGFEIAASAQNLFDRLPPEYSQNVFGIFYDSANANPFGRILSVRVIEKW